MEGNPPRTDFIEAVAQRTKTAAGSIQFIPAARESRPEAPGRPRFVAGRPAAITAPPYSYRLAALQTIQYLKAVLTDVNNSHLC